jgi:hypothetical protein
VVAIDAQSGSLTSMSERWPPCKARLTEVTDVTCRSLPTFGARRNKSWPFRYLSPHDGRLTGIALGRPRRDVARSSAPRRCPPRKGSCAARLPSALKPDLLNILDRVTKAKAIPPRPKVHYLADRAVLCRGRGLQRL